MTTPVLLPLLLLLVACLGEAALQRKALGSEAGAGSYNVTWKSSVSITAFDGTILRADAFVPVPSSPTELFPVIIFPNSWGVPQIEYILRAWNIAERGFIGFEYETRGWYISGGEIDTAGPKDRKDASSMIDFILAQKDWQPDPNKIAFVGISYGAGISLMMAGYDARVTTSVVMSGWNNITDMLYGNQSPNLQVNHLVNSALRHGRLSQEILQMRDDLLAHRNMSFVLNFSSARCPQDWVAAMNARQVPLFISANYEDDIFRPQYMTAFFENVLTVPRRMLLNEGGHAAPEAVGLLVHDNYIWHRVGEWLAYWLQGVENGVMNGPMIEMQVGPGIASPNYLPVSNMKQTSMTFFMGPRGADGRGTLNTTIPTAGSAVESPIVFSLSPGFSAGTGKETEMDLGEEYVVSLVQNTSTSVVWVSEPLASTVYVCGIPNVTLSFRTNDESWQFYTTVYDVSPTNTSQGSLLTHGFFSWYENGPVTSAGQQAATRNSADGSWTITGVKQHNMCRQVLVGHSIAVALVLSEQNAFKAAKEDPSLSLSVLYRGASSVTIPIVYGQ